MLAELQFTAARSALTELFDNVVHRSLPAIVTRRQTEEVLLMRSDLLKSILDAYPLVADVLPEDDGSVTLALDELDLAVNGPSLDKALDELVNEIKVYAEDYRDRLQLFLNAPNRRGHFPYVLRVWLCDNDEEIKGLLELANAA